MHAEKRNGPPKGRLAETVAEMCIDNGVVQCAITTSDTKIEIWRDDVPAIATVKERRAGASVPKTADLSRRRALHVEDAASATSMDEIPLSENVGFLDELRTEVVRPRDGRIYTMVGNIRPPGAKGNVVPENDWEFVSQSGKRFIAHGVDAARIRLGTEGAAVIRAEVVGKNDDGFMILEVKDLFEPEEP